VPSLRHPSHHRHRLCGARCSWLSVPVTQRCFCPPRGGRSDRKRSPAQRPRRSSRSPQLPLSTRFWWSSSSWLRGKVKWLAGSQKVAPSRKGWQPAIEIACVWVAAWQRRRAVLTLKRDALLMTTQLAHLGASCRTVAGAISCSSVLPGVCRALPAAEEGGEPAERAGGSRVSAEPRASPVGCRHLCLCREGRCRSLHTGCDPRQRSARTLGSAAGVGAQ